MGQTFMLRMVFTSLKSQQGGNSLVVQWLRLGAFTAMGPGWIHGQGTKIPQATRPKKKKKRSQQGKKRRICDTDCMWSQMPKIFTIWPFTEKVCQSLVYQIAPVRGEKLLEVRKHKFAKASTSVSISVILFSNREKINRDTKENCAGQIS